MEVLSLIFFPHSYTWACSKASPFNFSPLPERRDSKWTYIRTNEIWFTDRFRLHHVHRSECLRKLGMGTVEDHYLAETHTVILNRLIFCSYA